jgi:hypothetical protein
MTCETKTELKSGDTQRTQEGKMMGHDKAVDRGLAFAARFYAQRENNSFYSTHERVELRWFVDWDEAGGPLDEKPTASILDATGRRQEEAEVSSQHPSGDPMLLG